MPSVRIRENEYFDAALRRFKRACEKAGILTELRRREFYRKAHARAEEKEAAAIKRPHEAHFQGRRSPRPLMALPSTTMSLKERITEDMKSAMRAAQKERLGTVRMILAGIKQREVDERVTWTTARCSP